MRDLPRRLPTELLWVQPVRRPPIDIIVRVALALRRTSTVPDSIAVMLIRHWMQEINKDQARSRKQAG